MKCRRHSFYAVLMLAVACDYNRGRVDRDVADVLHTYAPGLRLYESIADAKAWMPALKFPDGGPFYRAPLPNAPGGFETVELIDERLNWDREPSDDAQVVRIEFTTRNPKGSAFAEADIAQSIAIKPVEGCIGGAGGQPRDRVLRWEGRDSGGIILVTPYDRSGLNRGTIALTRLVFFGGRWSPKLVGPDYLGDVRCSVTAR